MYSQNDGVRRNLLWLLSIFCQEETSFLSRVNGRSMEGLRVTQRLLFVSTSVRKLTCWACVL